MVQGVFKRLTAYDFQALCLEVRELPNDCDSLINVTRSTYYRHRLLGANIMKKKNLSLQPLRTILFSLRWLIAELFFYLARIQCWTFGLTCKIHSNAQRVNLTHSNYKYIAGLDADQDFFPPTTRYMRKGQNQEEENYFNRVIEKEYETIYRACDKKTDLYILQQNLFSETGQISSHMNSSCARYDYSA